MSEICLSIPLPSLDGILNAFKPLLTFPPKFPFNLLRLPTLPSPLFPGLRMPNFEMVITAIELQAFQLQTTIMGMIKPLLSKLGIALSSFLPKLPGLPDFNLIDLLAGVPDRLIAALRGVINSLHLPNFPSPMFPRFKIPEIEILQKMQLVIANYMQTVANLIPGLVKRVTDVLKIGAMSFSLSFPSLDSVLARLQALTFNLPDFNIASLLAGISFPGLPAFPSISLPFVFSFKMPDIEFTAALTALYNHLTMGFLKPILDFIMNTLSKFLSFSFPLICINVPG
jgi:hypothetical protein